MRMWPFVLLTIATIASSACLAPIDSESRPPVDTITPPPPPPPPSDTITGRVTDLHAAGTTSVSATLMFTEVSDGTGRPASYDVRYTAGPMNWGSAPSVTQGTCATPLAGAHVGATLTCTVLGLAPGTAYQFQAVAFRGTLNLNARFGSLSPVASVVTAGSTAPVAAVVLTPPSAGLFVGGTQQFAATLRDAGGSLVTGRTITWQSSNTAVASVGATGLATAKAVGTATVTATSEGKSGSAAVTVDSALPPPAGGAWPNEPQGWAVVNDYDMSGLNAGRWLNVYASDITGGGFSVTSDATAPASPPGVWQFAYPAGFTGSGLAPATEYFTMTPASALYVGFWWKPSNPWQGHSTGVNKLMFLFTGDPRTLSGNMTIQMFGFGNGPFKTRMVGEGFEDVSYAENAGSTSPLTLGVWHRIEILMNAPTGALRWWVDGKLIGSYSGVPYPAAGFFQLEFSPTWGGVAGSAKGENDFFWFDHVHVSRP